MKSRITGTTMPVLEIGLEEQDRIISEPGQFSWMSPNVTLESTVMTAGATGLWGAIGRAFAGGGLFMNEYSARSGQGMVAFATKVPGSIIEIQVSPERQYMIHRHGFLCGTHGINLAIGFQQSLGAGIFGGNGFILQKISGDATAWVELSGEVVSYDLPPGDSLIVHPGHVGMFEASVNFEISTIPGIKNKFFGGDGIFVCHLTGPGRIWLQTLTVPNLADTLAPYLSHNESTSTVSMGGATGAATSNTFTGAVAGSILGSALDGLFKREE